MTMPYRWRLSVAILAAATIVAGYGVTQHWLQLSPAATETPLQGTVVGRSGPLAEATVRLKGTPFAARTDSDGRFQLPLGVSDAAMIGLRRITAAAPGHYIGGFDRQSGKPLRLQLEAYSKKFDPAQPWISPHAGSEHPKQCGNCHAEIVEEWSGSAHANSAVNPYFRNVYDGTDAAGNADIGANLLAEYPEGAGVCYSCHVPSMEPTLANLSDLREVSGVHAEGIHCDFCHKIAEVKNEPLGLNHGRFAMTLVRPATQDRTVLFGPLDDCDRSEGELNDNVFSPLYRESRYCASCHEGLLFGTHAYSTYSEWLESPQAAAGVQCQTCHMAPTGKLTNMAPGHGGVERDPQSLASHTLVGSGAEFLREHLTLDLRLQETEQGLEATATVAAIGIGHRTPTGHPSRQLLLCVEATDEHGKSVYMIQGLTLPKLAGEGNAADGALAGLPGKLYAKALEDVDGNQAIPYWRPNRVAYDTRLQPDERDSQRFIFAAGNNTQVKARLIYRRFSYAEAREKSWTDTETLLHEQTKRWPSSPAD